MENKYEADRTKMENEIKRLRADPDPKPIEDDKIIQDVSWFSPMLVGDAAVDIVAQLAGIVPLEKRLCNDKNGISTLPEYYEYTLSKSSALKEQLQDATTSPKHFVKISALFSLLRTSFTLISFTFFKSFTHCSLNLAESRVV